MMHYGKRLFLTMKQNYGKVDAGIEHS